jgi:hypothetical protein
MIFCQTFKFSLGGALKYWHVIPTGAKFSITDNLPKHKIMKKDIKSDKYGWL